MTKFVEILENASPKDVNKSLEVIKNHVKDNGKSILFLTASWCGPCKAFKPTISDFKAKMNKTSGLVAHVDVIHHDKIKEIIDVDINGYPTVAKAEGKTETTDGTIARDLESLIKLHKDFFSSKGGKRRKKKRKTYKSKTKKRKKRHRKRKKTRKRRKKRKSRKKVFSPA